MPIIKVLGSSSLIGKYFIDTNFDYELVCFSRKNKNHTFLDLQNKDTFSNFSCENSLLVSFAPIWLVKDLIIQLEENNLNKLKTLKGAIIYSSSSAITKKFAANASDKNLSKLSAISFINDILINQLQAKNISVGANFRIGFRRSGDINTIKNTIKDLDIKLKIISILEDKEGRISSSRVRELLKKSDLKNASKILNRAYSKTM